MQGSNLAVGGVMSLIRESWLSPEASICSTEIVEGRILTFEAELNERKFTVWNVHNFDAQQAQMTQVAEQLFG